MDLSKKKKKKKKRDSNIMAHNNPQLVLVTTFTILSQKSNRYNFLPLRLSSFEKKRKKATNKIIVGLPLATKLPYLISFYWKWILTNPLLDYIIFFLYPLWLQNFYKIKNQ